MTSSHTRSDSRPVHPALLVMPSGRVRVDNDSVLLTTAMCAYVCEAMSSRRRRTSALSVGFEEGESRISERATLMDERFWLPQASLSGTNMVGVGERRTGTGHPFRSIPLADMTCG